jgi:hypothetical protein
MNSVLRSEPLIQAATWADAAGSVIPAFVGLSAIYIRYPGNCFSDNARSGPRSGRPTPDNVVAAAARGRPGGSLPVLQARKCQQPVARDPN